MATTEFLSQHDSLSFPKKMINMSNRKCCIQMSGYWFRREASLKAAGQEAFRRKKEWSVRKGPVGTEQGCRGAGRHRFKLRRSPVFLSQVYQEGRWRFVMEKGKTMRSLYSLKKWIYVRGYFTYTELSGCAHVHTMLPFTKSCFLGSACQQSLAAVCS